MSDRIEEMRGLCVGDRVRVGQRRGTVAQRYRSEHVPLMVALDGMAVPVRRWPEDDVTLVDE